jgi:hypothetical protein
MIIFPGELSAIAPESHALGGLVAPGDTGSPKLWACGPTDGPLIEA